MRSKFKRAGQSVGRNGTRELSRNMTGGTIPLTLTISGDIYYVNQRVGYLDEDDVLFGMNRAGYALRIGPSSRAEAVQMLRDWWNEASS